ncbi:MAG: DUF5672 family protein [Lachnospiraceae bacterium]
MKKKVVIIIPLYKSKLEENEKISLEQVFRVLSRYDICLIGPEKMQFSFLESRTGKFYWECFPAAYFESVSSYNQLMLNEAFYCRFSDYEYMLIYQLDAFVFSDKLEYFCSLGYDYIGAPWLCGEVVVSQGEKVCCHVGNGGFSLRRIESARKLLNKNKICNEQNEDIFFSTSAGDDFNVAPIDVALKFSFERQVRECYEKNQYELPFGCHAWEKYDLEFWKPFIEQYGYKIEASIQESQNDRLLIPFYKAKEKESYICKYGWENYLKSQFSNQNGKIVLWGAGFWGQKVCRFLRSNGVEIAYVIDNAHSLQGEYLEGIKIIGCDKIPQNEPWNILVSVVKYREEIIGQLEALGLKYGKQFIFYEDIIDRECLL